MAVENDFVEGIDPTPLTEITQSELLQLIRQALPESNRGLIIYSASSPDIVSNPHLTRYLWIDVSIFPATINYYNTTTASWEPIPLGAGVIVNDMIADGTIDLSKLDISGANPLDLIRVNAGGTALEFFAFTIGAGSLNINTLDASGAAVGDLLKVNGSNVLEFFTLDALNYIATNAMPLNRLVKGTAYYLLGLNSVGNPTYVRLTNSHFDDNSISGSKLQDSSVPLSKLVSSPGVYNTFSVTSYAEIFENTPSDDLVQTIAAIANDATGWNTLLQVNSRFTGGYDYQNIVYDQAELDNNTGSPGSVLIDDIEGIYAIAEINIVDTRSQAGILAYESNLGGYIPIVHLETGDPTGTDREEYSGIVFIPKTDTGKIDIRLAYISGLNSQQVGIRFIGYK